MEGQPERGPEPGGRLLAGIDHPAAAWVALCGVLVLLTCFAAAGIFLADGVPRATRRTLAISNAFAHLAYAALAPVLLHVLERHPFARRHLVRAAAWHVATALALGSAAVLVMQFGLHLTVRPLASVEAVLRRTGQTYRYNLHDIFFIYALLAGTAAALSFFRRERRRGLSAIALGRELTAAHLETLRVRVDPHFLFNTLNALLPLVATRPEAACDAVVRLGTLLRFGFRHAASDLVPLRDEAEYIRCLLVLEEMRVSDRLCVLVDFSPEVLDAAVPALVLKPFVEAALEEGVFRRPGPALLEVVGRRVRDHVVVRVRSTACGTTGPAAAPTDDPGISAAAARIAAAFGEAGSVHATWSTEGALDAQIRFPWTSVPPATVPASRTPPEVASPPRSPAAHSATRRSTPLLDRPARLAGLAAVFWLATGLYYGSQAHLRSGLSRHAEKVPATARYVPSLARSAVWALLTPAVLLLYRRRPLSRRPLFAVPIHLLAAAAATLVVTAAEQVVARSPAVSLSAPRPFAEHLARATPTEAGTYLLVASVLLVLDVARRARAAELRSARLEALLAEARLAALGTQLHPHFLFNTLNSLLPLITVDPRAAARVLVQLGDLLRASFRHDPSNLVPLSEEVDFLRRYLEIEATRFRDRLTIRFDIGEETLAAAVPSLVLQPLIENAVKHGVSRRPGPGTIRLAARRETEVLVVEVHNDAAPADAAPLSSSNGVGLANTRSRLFQLYGSDASLETGPDADEGFLAVLRVPWLASAQPDAPVSRT